MRTLCVCPTYGRLPYLGRVLASFLSQKYDDKHLVIINDDVNIELCCSEKNVTVLNCNQKLTVAQKRNIGISIGEHDIIFPFDDDDVFLPQRIGNHVLKHVDNSAYRNDLCYVIYGDEFLIGGSSPSAMSFKKDEWYRIKGYKILEDPRADDAHLFWDIKNGGNFHNEKDIENLDFVYHFGGVNYHLTSSDQNDIERIAYQQLVNMNLVGKKYWIEPDYEKFHMITRLVDNFEIKKEKFKVIHGKDCEITIDNGY